MKNVFRSKSDTNIFFDKENLNLIQDNLNKLKKPKTLLIPNSLHSDKKLPLLNLKKNENGKLKFIKILEPLASANNILKSSHLLNLNSHLFNKEKREEEIEKNFQKQLTMIIRFKLEFDSQYLQKVIFERKIYMNLLLEILLAKLKKLRENYIRDLNNESVYESPLSISRIESHISNYKIPQTPFIQNFPINESMESFDKFEGILKILIDTPPEELFREVKTIILTEFEKSMLEIHKFLDKKHEKSFKIFTWISQTILFILSEITVRLDIYSLTINCLIDRMNRVFVDYIDDSSSILNKNQDCKYFNKNLNIIHRFVRLKKYFIKDFCQNNKSEFKFLENEKMDNDFRFKFSFNKFNSFGKYLFNNFVILMNVGNSHSESNKIFSPYKGHPISVIKNYTNFKEMIKQKESGMKMHAIIKINKKSNFSSSRITCTIQPPNTHLDIYFKLYFTFKLANWKYTALQSENFQKKIEICRICENTFTINEFILHIQFCKDQRVYYKKVIEFNKVIGSTLERLKVYKEQLLQEIKQNKIKDIFFSPKSELNQIFRSHLTDRTPNINNLKNKLNKRDKSEVELLDTLIRAITKEKDMYFIDYEKHPYKLSHLISIVHFCVVIFHQNSNCKSFSRDLNEIFSKLFNVLMKKMFIVENILTLQDNRERAKMKTKNFYYNKSQPSVTNTPLITFREMDDRSSLNNLINKASPKKPNESKIFLMKLDDTQNKFKKNVGLTARSPNSSQNKKQYISNNSLPQCPPLQQKTTFNSMTSMLFPKVAKVEPNKLGLVGLNKITPRNSVEESGMKMRSPRDKEIKAVGKELKMFASKISNIETNILGTKLKNLENSDPVTENDSYNNSNLNTPKTNLLNFNYSPIYRLDKNYSKQKANTIKENHNLIDTSVSCFSRGNVYTYTNKLPTISFSGTSHSTFGSASLSPKLDKFETNINKIEKIKNQKRSLFKCNNQDADSPNQSNSNNNIIFNDLKSNLDSSIDSELSYMDKSKNKRKLDKNDSSDKEIDIVLNEEISSNNFNQISDSFDMDEIESQFEEILDLMDEIQLTDQNDDRDMSIIRDEAELDSSINSIVNESNLNNQTKISDFKFMKEIAKGGYGRVDIYKKIKTGDIYAIKTVNINKMMAKNVGGLLKKETLIFNEIFSDYVVKCFWMFSDTSYYYFVMEFLAGGNLLNFLNSYMLKIETIQLIIAEVLLALEYLHSKNIIHRDIKPENIVISYEGHFKLTDFGISDVGLQQNKYAISNFDIEKKFNSSDDFNLNPHTILGTEHYLAPEIINDEQITNKADYWALGVMMYELFTNKLPFMAENFQQISDNILNLKINWEPFDHLPEDYYDIEIIKDAKDLIMKFLVVDSDLRLGSDNLDEIKNHPFFKKFDWKNVKNIVDPTVKGHVLNQIKEINKKSTKVKEVKEVKEEEDNNDEKNLNKTVKFVNFPSNDPNQTTQDDFISSERIDNLYLVCQDVIKKNIKQKLITYNSGDEKFTNFMFDLVD